MRLEDRLRAARRQGFVGRTAELRAFHHLIEGPTRERVLYLHGPPGIGKTALLARFAELAPPGRLVVVDDHRPGLDPLPEVGDETVLVLAGQSPPPHEWLADLGWRGLVRSIRLGPLDDDASRRLLAAQGVTDIDAVSAFCHGHPLALALAASVDPDNRRLEVAQALREVFLRDAPAAALEAAAHLRVTTEPLLAAVLDVPDAGEPFARLRTCSVVETDADGLSAFAVVREALVTELRWRDPDRQELLHERARRYYRGQLPRADAPHRRKLLLDYMYLHRDHPALRAHLRPLREAPEDIGALRVDAVRDDDWAALLDMVVRHEGPDAAEVAEHWFTCQPDGVRVVRDTDDAPRGFLAVVALHEATEEERAADPATRAAWRFLNSRAALRQGEGATITRFWLAADTYQDVSPVQSLLTAEVTRHFLTTPRLAYTFMACADPDGWVAESAAYADMARLADADFELGGHHYGVFGHDWRQTPTGEWLELLAAREEGRAASSGRRLVLGEREFAAEVRNALRKLTSVDGLLGSPLLRCRFLDDRVSADARDVDRARALQSLLREAAESLRDNARDVKLHRALHHTYLRPAASQEQAAELLRLPSSTFRRHLSAGVRRVTEILWERELTG